MIARQMRRKWRVLKSKGRCRILRIAVKGCIEHQKMRIHLDRIGLQSSLLGSGRISPMNQTEKTQPWTNNGIKLSRDAVWHVDQRCSSIDGLRSQRQMRDPCGAITTKDERRRYLCGRYQPN